MVMAPPARHDSSIALLPWLPGFPPQAFPTTTSFLTPPQCTSLQSIAALALGLLHSPQTSAPSHCTFQGTCIPVQGMYGWSKDCLILTPFRLPQISCYLSALNVSPLTQTIALMWELDPCFSSQRAGPVLLTLLFSPLVPSSY